uniref:CS domain-containing protein n=2 Tax=Meloidogyne hapla TaxID=6305 RepID=A0A1I8BI31_MELHA
MASCAALARAFPLFSLKTTNSGYESVEIELVVPDGEEPENVKVIYKLPKMLEKLEENYALRTEASHAILVAKIDASHSILQAKIEASNWVSTFKNGLFFSFLGIGLKIVWDKYNEYKDNQAIQEIDSQDIEK